MKKYCTTALLAMIIALLLPVSSYAESKPRHAPNMYIDWSEEGVYDAMTVDWYCETDAKNTYWAVHNWDNGYAGFQNLDGQHIVLLSLWDLDDGTQPAIEYAAGGKTGRFGGEGTGAQVFTNYGWESGTWYTMRIQVWDEDGKSCFGQWVRPENGDWELTAIISYPVEGMHFAGNSFFQEDFTFNNRERKCRLKNSYTRKQDGSWVNQNVWALSNTYFPTDPPTWDDVQWNVSFDCDWGIDEDYIWISSGGAGFDDNGKTMPCTYTVSQPSAPEDGSWFSVNCLGEAVATPSPSPTPQPEREETPAPTPEEAPPATPVPVEAEAAPTDGPNKTTILVLCAIVALLVAAVVFLLLKLQKKKRLN